jgi:GNAT superfamily N-acetyltransferase
MVDSLALAFADDPVMAWVFGDGEAKVVRGCRKLFTVDGKRHLRHDVVLTADDFAGASYWDPPNRWKNGWRDALQLVPTMTFAVGPRIPRALRGFAKIEAVHDKFPAHYYLSLLGTRPERQGEGVGSALVQPVLDRCDREGVGAFLESSKEANIPFYERHGFRVQEVIDLPSGPSLWAMWRDPQPPGGE